MRLNIDAIFTCETQDITRKLRLQFIGTIAEISLSCTDVRCVRHRIFASFRKTENIRRQVFSLFSI